jgi:hypothetical protein
MTVIENQVLTRDGLPAVIDSRRETRDLERFLAQISFDVPLDARVSSLSADERQKCETLKQLYLERREGRFRPAHRVRGELPWVKTDVGNPSLHQARVLPRRQRSIWAASTWKQNLPRLPTAAAQIRVERLARLLGQFEPHRPTGFPLAHVGAADCVALRRHVIDAQCHEIASAQFAVDRQVEEG